MAGSSSSASPSSWFAMVIVLCCCGSTRALSSTTPASSVKGSAADSFATSSPIARNVVKGLTWVVNRRGAEKVPAARERLKSLVSPQELLAGLGADFVEGEYLWSGRITPELYDEQCVFTDPTLSFDGLRTFETNLKNLDPIIERYAPPDQRRLSLVDLRLDIDLRVVTAQWRMLGAVDKQYPSYNNN
jgi:hypothetical protein